MKSIRTNAIITSISSKKDGSLGFRVNTPELTSEEKVAFMGLQGINLDAYFKPLDFKIDEVIEVDKDVEQKSQSQRIRSVLFLIWKQEGEQGEFATFYKEKTEKYINYLKDMLD